MSGRDIVQQIAKHFSERLNQALDELGTPNTPRERAIILSKMIDIPKQQAWSLLDGHVIPDEALLQRIADELEVEKKWLLDSK